MTTILTSSSIVLSDGVDRDSGGESRRRDRAGRDILSLCLSRLETHVSIHLHCPDPPSLTVQYPSFQLTPSMITYLSHYRTCKCVPLMSNNSFRNVVFQGFIEYAYEACLICFHLHIFTPPRFISFHS